MSRVPYIPPDWTVTDPNVFDLDDSAHASNPVAEPLAGVGQVADLADPAVATQVVGRDHDVMNGVGRPVHRDDVRVVGQEPAPGQPLRQRHQEPVGVAQRRHDPKELSGGGSSSGHAGTVARNPQPIYRAATLGQCPWCMLQIGQSPAVTRYGRRFHRRCAEQDEAIEAWSNDTPERKVQRMSFSLLKAGVLDADAAARRAFERTL